MGRKGKELTPQLRSRICELRSIGWSYSKIKAKHPEVPLSTIKSTVLNEQKRADNQSKLRSGRPRQLTEAQRDHIYDLSQSSPHLKMQDLLTEVDGAVKKRSLQYLLRELGLRKWRQLQRPALTVEQALACLNWANRYQYFTPEDWARVKWTDECLVERGVGIQPIWTFRRPRDQLLEHDVCTRRTGKGVKQMFWAGFGEDIRTGLVPLDGDPESARGGVTGQIIRDLYQAWLPELIKPGDIFMQDNASVHTARIVKEVLNSLQIEVMIWPPYSPDLNPIENLWSIMKQKIYMLYPDLEDAPNTEATRQLLILAAKEAWQSIDTTILQKLSRTMPNRVKAVIEADGWYTKY